jgi:arabinogalactan endo-1,4-beta-galactosidase
MTLSKYTSPPCLAARIIACGLATTCLLGSYAHAAEFMAGADISSLPIHENNGAVYRSNGVERDAIEILRDQGTNWFRLRLFVDPQFENNYNGGFDPFVAQDLEYTIALAQRVKQAGGKILLDFHYSDTWADPGHQSKPEAWESLSTMSALQQQVYDYTRDSIEAFKTAGVLPEMVQIGNEIANGMLWNDPGPGGANSGYPWTGGSHSTGFNRLATLLSAGINGARDGAGLGEEPLIMIHHDKGSQWNTTQFYFDQLLPRLQSNGTDIDVIGYSYYPQFHTGGVAGVEQNLNNTAAKYGKPVVIAETGFPFSNPQSDEQNLGFPVTQAGQQEFLQAIVDAVQNVPNDMGLGAFWWYAEARPTTGLNVWENGRYGLFDQNGNVLPSTSVFNEVNVPGDYNFDGLVDGGDLEVWSSLYGQSGHALDADGDRDGDVDGRDFLFWQRNFTGSEVLSAVSVPEPNTLALLGVLLIATARKRHSLK